MLRNSRKCFDLKQGERQALEKALNISMATHWLKTRRFELILPGLSLRIFVICIFQKCKVPCSFSPSVYCKSLNLGCNSQLFRWSFICFISFKRIAQLVVERRSRSDRREKKTEIPGSQDAFARAVRRRRYLEHELIVAG
jgi:hypothetical protein